MDCNREEALRAKELAEKKFALQDFAGAKRILAKAEQLYPKLDGLQQLLAVINVHSTSQAKFADELDWYGILEAEVTADDATIRKQYRKLALILHPDKNKYAGAEAAFKLVAEAFAVLSDKTKRLAHDRKRIMNHTTSGILNAYYGSAPRPTAPAASPAYQSAFWTACPNCRMQYQYPKIYENCRLSCGKCKKDFEAKDVHAALNGHGFPNSVNGRPVNGGAGPFFHQSSPHVFHHVNPAANMQAGVAAAAASASSAAAPSSAGAGATYTAEYVQQMYRKAKEEREENKRRQKVNEREQKRREREELKKLKELEKGKREAMKNLKDELCKRPEMENLKKDVLEEESSKQPEVENLREDVVEKEFSKSKPEKSRKRPRSDEDDDQEEVATEVLHELRNGPPRRSSRLRRNVTYKFDEDDDVVEFPSRKKSKDEPVEQENRGSVSSGSGVPMESGIPNDNVATIIKGMANQSDKLNDDPPVEPARPPQTPVEPAQVAPDSSGDSPASADQKKTIIQVPDTDFHDFDEERNLHNVRETQVWAVYDDFNGMPRFYCRLMKVKSPEKIRAKWLQAVEASKDTRLWLQAGFHLACGELRLMPKGNVDLSTDMLSHELRVDSQKGVWKIYPRGGEVWCLYQNWHRDWLTSSEKRDISYVMVEVVNDFSEEKGVNIAPLFKVQGFSTVFAREVPGSWKHVAAEEILKFSHRVPAFHLTGKEGPGVPQGSWELDPAAVPAELLDSKKL